MKSKFLFVSLFSIFILSKSLSAQCDPWIEKAYKQLYNRAANSEECNIRNYNNGSWSSYEQLVGYIKAYKLKSSNAGFAMPELKGDPWIFQIYQQLYNRKPNAWELNISNYNGGSWKNYDELKNYVKEFQTALSKKNLEIKTAGWANNNVLVGFFIDGKQVAVNVVSAGGGNVVSAGGANVVSAGGANVVSAGGANILVNSSMAGVSFGGRYVTQSAGTTVVPTSGSSAMIIR